MGTASKMLRPGESSQFSHRPVPGAFGKHKDAGARKELDRVAGLARKVRLGGLMKKWGFRAQIRKAMQRRVA